MKSFLVTILAVFYLVITVGFINCNRYCPDRLMTASIVMSSKGCEKCSTCVHEEKQEDRTCCKHSKEYIRLKVDQTHSAQNTDITPRMVAILDIFLSGFIIPDINTVGKETYPVTNAPPLGAQNPIHILNCTYLI